MIAVKKNSMDWEKPPLKLNVYYFCADWKTDGAQAGAAVVVHSRQEQHY